MRAMAAARRPPDRTSRFDGTQAVPFAAAFAARQESNLRKEPIIWRSFLPARKNVVRS
jgi:hypothetical protein